MPKPSWLYWIRFARDEGLPVLLEALPPEVRRYRWQGIYGVQIGSWFFGAIKGHSAP